MTCLALNLSEYVDQDSVLFCLPLDSSSVAFFP